MPHSINGFVKKLAGRIDGVEAIKNMLVLSPSRSVVRGFLFERSSEKSAYYIWRLILPMFSPEIPSILLNYSSRISLNGRVQAKIRIDDIDKNTLKEIAEKLIVDHFPYLQRVDSVAAFLSEFDSKGLEWRPNVKLELAFAKMLTGDFLQGNKMIDEILRLPVDSPIIPSVQAHAEKIAETAERGPAALFSYAAEIEEANMSVLFPGIKFKSEFSLSLSRGFS